MLRAATGSNQAGFQLQAANSLTPKEHYIHGVAVHLYIHLSICCEELKVIEVQTLALADL